MIKKFQILLFLISLVSCRDSNSNLEQTHNNHNSLVGLEKGSKELRQFDTLIVKLYEETEKKPETMIVETERLIMAISQSNDSNNTRRNKINSLHSIRAEIFYRLGEYKRSIDEIFLRVENDINMFGSARLFDSEKLTLACNYIKLKDFEKAKNYIDSIVPGYYIYNYILGNYFEVTRNKERALEVYKEIEGNGSVKHYLHYNWAIERITELQKSDPRLLDELYYPTERPDLKYSLAPQ